MDKDIATLSKTTEILKKYNFRLKKALGQNLLVDVNILKKIVANADITPQTGVIEIGPGIGSLTEQLAKVAKKVIAYEIDTSLQPILAETLASYQNIQIIYQDILKADVHKMIEEELSDCQDIVVVANLPYYITTPILMKLIEDQLPINRFCVMMQKEVAERLCGGPSTKDYNSLSIAIQYYTSPKIIMSVPKTVFIPQPNVDSAVLKLTVHVKPPVQLEDEALFFKVVRGSFIQRRKTIYNNLKQSLEGLLTYDEITLALNQAGLNPSIRGEALTMDQFALLANTIHHLIMKG